MPEHGGALRAAAARYGIALKDWLDLSTGINPRGWPVLAVPAEVWRRLPEADDGLERTAASYYGNDQLLPVAGSQAAIQALPRLRLPCRVGVLKPGYSEHAFNWRHHGHRVEELEAKAVETALDRLDVLVLGNPNNPTGDWFELEQLLAWRARLAARNGWLVVDEAFTDATPGLSLASQAGLPGLVILRSLGKFFGLAGVRIGFVLTETALRTRLQAELGPWAVNGPGRWVATQVLRDRAWQRRTQMQLFSASARLVDLLDHHGLTSSGGTAFFQWSILSDAERLQDDLARRGILVRRFSDPPSLRFGLPGTETDWQRLTLALTEVCC